LINAWVQGTGFLARARRLSVPQVLDTIEYMSLRDGYRFEQNLTVQLSEHPDAKKATAAFLQKRKLVFRDG
jgi:hypothetical protein